MTKLIVGLAGNPNVGKTTVFNQLTGMRQHVGNWPGKTVERAEGHFKHGSYEYDVVDLPGNYALSAHSMEEIVSRDFIVDDDSDVIVNVVDAANLERNLYLTVQMMELGANLVMALNMNDFAKKKEHIIDIPLMSELLGFPVVEITPFVEICHIAVLWIFVIEGKKSLVINGACPQIACTVNLENGRSGRILPFIHEVVVSPASQVEDFLLCLS